MTADGVRLTSHAPAQSATARTPHTHTHNGTTGEHCHNNYLSLMCGQLAADFLADSLITFKCYCRFTDGCD